MTSKDIRKFFGLAKQSSLPEIVIPMFVVLIWAVEQFLLQGLTLTPDMAIDDFRQLKRESVRFAINFSFGAILVLSLPKKLLYVLLVASCLIDSGLVAYHDYFQQPLSRFTLTTHVSESLEVMGAFVDYFPAKIFFILLTSLIIKMLLMSQLKVKSKTQLRYLKHLQVLFSLLYLFIVLPLVMFYRPMSELKTWKSTSWFGGVYGYFITWVGESYYLGSSESLLQYANSVANPARRSLPSPITAIGFSDKNHVTVIQCESLSYWASELEGKDGEYLMPFLNIIKKDSISLRIEPLHRVGSADADFCFLNSKYPNGKVAPYKVIGFDYSDAMPFLAKRLGFQSNFYHGNRGSFFARRTPFLNMGFTRVFFQEELENEGLPLAKWGIHDHHVFKLSSRHLAESPEPMFHFLISLTTHSPFNFLPKEYHLQSGSNHGKLSKYYNNMRYLDDCLKNYYSSLPEGTWMILYGDHGPGFRKEESGFTESVPFIVARKGFSLKLTKSQQEKIDPSIRQFDLLDLSRYFREELNESLP